LIPVCKNCGSSNILVKWVRKSEKSDIVSFEKYANKLLEERKNTKHDIGSLYSSTISYPFPSLGSVPDPITNYAQLVLTCKNCGYTIVINIDSWLVANDI